MKKTITFLILIIIAATMLFTLSGCSKSTDAAQYKVTYSESDWKQNIEAVKADNVALSANGKSDYAIVYPDIIDDPFIKQEGKKELSPLENEVHPKS